MPMNLGPDPSFMQRMLGATNAAGQSMGGPMGQTSRLSAGINQGRINRPAVMPNRQTTPNSGMMPSGLPNPGPMNGMGGQPPTMPFVQGPSALPDFQFGRDTGGNTGVTGGMNFGGMGGFPRPQIETGNVMNDNQMGGGIWNRYQNMQRPQMSPMFR